MSYQSVIELVATNIRIKEEDLILKAVQDVGVTVDKDELMKALRYDRDQYYKGYKDRDAEIVRCGCCKYGEPCNEDVYCTKDIGTIKTSMHKPVWFCADGERQ